MKEWIKRNLVLISGIVLPMLLVDVENFPALNWLACKLRPLSFHTRVKPVDRFGASLANGCCYR